MSVPTQLAPAPPVSSETYRPVTASAIIGLALAGFGLLIFVLRSPWFLTFVVLPALLISILARRQVLRSEGTLAGGTIALIGIILALVCGLGWVTSYFTAYFVVRAESLAFVDDWAGKLKQGQAGHAFLDSVEAAERDMREDWKENVQRLRDRFPVQDRGFDAFRKHMLVELALRYGDQVTWVHKGIDQWEYEKGTFTVHHRFHVECPSHAGDVIVVATSESGVLAGKPREWRIDLAPSDVNGMIRGVKPHGERVGEAQTSASLKLQEWVSLIALRRTGEAKIALLPPLEVVRLPPVCLLALAPSVTPPIATGCTIHGVCTAAPWLQPLTPEVQARMIAFDKFYQRLRAKNESHGIQLQFPMLIWKEKRHGDEWELLLEGTVLNGPVMVDYEVTMIGIPNKEWRITDCKVLREAAAKQQSPGAPMRPPLPTMPGAN